MRKRTYDNLQQLSNKYGGYIRTSELLNEGITNRQIAEFVKEGTMEKIAFGIYWIAGANISKPDHYKMIEASLINPKVVVCAASACHWWGLTSTEPQTFSIATQRTDRTKMEMNYQISRHYFSERYFDDDRQKVNTKYGGINIYGINRSVCQCICYRNETDDRVYREIMKSYLQHPDRNLNELYKHADHLKVRRIVEAEIEKYRADLENECKTSVVRKLRSSVDEKIRKPSLRGSQMERD